MAAPAAQDNERRGRRRENGMTQPSLPMLGFVAPSGSGKTTLLRKLVPMLRARGLRVGYLKHSHHPLGMDRPGKDSHALAEAGAEQVLLAAAGGWALLDYAPTVGPGGEVPMASLVARFDAERLDLLLVEGFRGQHQPKIEVHRSAVGKAPLYPDDADIIAVVTDAELPQAAAPELLPLDDPAVVADFIEARLNAGQLNHTDPRDELLEGCRALHRRGIEPRAGWLSTRVGERCWLLGIPLTGDVPDGDAVATYLIAAADAIDDDTGEEAVPARPALMESVIHRRIYAAQPLARALVGARMPHTAAVGFQGRGFQPPDADTAALLGVVPVLSFDPDDIPRKAPAAIAEQLLEAPACIIAGQGAYAWGTSLREALERAALLERAAQVYVLGRQTSV
jgi:molybdopterin-guanine dinucleotide biosynthesis protein B